MSEAAAADPRSFYTRTVPAQFNRTLDAQAALGDAGRRLHEQMRAVDGTIQIEFRGDDCARFFLNIAAGRMTAGDVAAHSPFLTLVLDQNAFARLSQQVGDSLTALLGALAGVGRDMKLTRKRKSELEAVCGLIRLEVTGDEGFVVLSHFGDQPRPVAPDATIRMTAASYRDLCEGRLEPQQGFLEDSIQVEGDVQKVMQLAFAAVAPD